MHTGACTPPDSTSQVKRVFFCASWRSLDAFGLEDDSFNVTVQSHTTSRFSGFPFVMNAVNPCRYLDIKKPAAQCFLGSPVFEQVGTLFGTWKPGSSLWKWPLSEGRGFGERLGVKGCSYQHKCPKIPLLVYLFTCVFVVLCWMFYLLLCWLAFVIVGPALFTFTCGNFPSWASLLLCCLGTFLSPLIFCILEVLSLIFVINLSAPPVTSQTFILSLWSSLWPF